MLFPPRGGRFRFFPAAGVLSPPALWYNRIMARPFRICLVVPPDYPHSACFRELALLLWSAIRDLGRECDVKVNELLADGINILLGYHLLTFNQQIADTAYIPFQLEQLSADTGLLNENTERILQRALQVWDYAPTNIRFLEHIGIDAVHVPIGWHANLQTITRVAEPDVDVLFYGSVGERRRLLLEKLAARFRLKVLFGLYGAERDAWIARSRIVLNIHHYAAQIFEAVRVSYLLNNGCLVVSEQARDISYPDIDLCLREPEELAEACAGLLRDAEAAENLRLTNQRLFRERYAMTDLLRPHLRELA